MDLVEEIKNRLNIEDVISEYVQLKRSGSNWRGLSPFNNEKTPSFMVSPEKQIWHDFSSGKGGNMFSFVMEMEGVDFKESLDILARKAGLDPDKFKKNNQSNVDKEKLYDLLEMATKYYQVQLKNSPIALDYVFKKRKFIKKTILDWRLGYSDFSKDGLKNFLLNRNFTLQEIRLTGLLTRNDEDMFRGRLMIPLQDERGRIIGYTARLLNDDFKNSPKYINTPQTVLYDKSRHVFGLHFAKDSFRKDKFAVMVEGNLDVISSHQVNQTNVVATAGTALTIYHFKTISRFVNDIRLCFDSDNAGIEATKRAIILASKINLDLSIINLIEGKDPDELIKTNPELWFKSVNNKIYAFDWLINYFKTIYDINSPSGKKNFSTQILPIIEQLNDEIEKDHYLNQISKILQVSKESIDKKSKKYETINQTKPIKKANINQQNFNYYLDESNKLETNFLSIVLIRSTLRDLILKLKPEYFLNINAQKLFKIIKLNPKITEDDILTSKQPEWKILDDYVKILSLLYDEKYRQVNLEDLHYEASFLRYRLVENYVKYKKEQLKIELINKNDDQSTKVLKNIDKLNSLLNVFKE